MVNGETSAVAVSLNDCPPGLFMFGEALGFKSEYVTTLENPRRYQCDAYVVASGEYFHGGARNSATRGALLVIPIDADRLTSTPQAASAIPDGWKLVPIEPTEHQRQRGAYQMSGMTREGARCVYAAMLAASPECPQAASAEVREATEEMLRAYAPHTTEHDDLLRAIWRTMSAAVPAHAPIGAGEGVGRFGHHPDAAIDFCHEVECCENDAFDLRAGGSREALTARIARAMSFRVGGDAGCVDAKHALRELEAAVDLGTEGEHMDELIAVRSTPAAAPTGNADAESGS